jgi:ferritin-like metal-binding protein YciE
MSPKDELLSWLNNAYAMELALVEVLDNHARDAAGLPHMRERLKSHIGETRIQADRLKNVIEGVGGKVSNTKALLGNLLGQLNAVSTGLYRDELVKNALGDFASEQLEIACYTSLIAAAEEIGLAQVAEVCRQNLNEEKAMGSWLEQQIPEITRSYLRTEAARMAA